MEFTGTCPVTRKTETIDIHPIYCGTGPYPGLYTKGGIISCTALGYKQCTYPDGWPIERNSPEIFRLK